ncbi:MAG TPA: peptidoglycan recognition protein family protein [Firmicutes bacterium]|nr:peptidoglycan recognition protein family protein [Bacillota bacterium]
MVVKYEGPSAKEEWETSSAFGIPVRVRDRQEEQREQERVWQEVKERRRLRNALSRRRQRRRLFALAGAAAAAAAAVAFSFGLRALWYAAPGRESSGGADFPSSPSPDWIDQQWIDNADARLGIPLTEVKDLAVHYVGNPGSSAAGNRNYFNTEGVDVCSHFIVGLEGEVIQCLPLNEQSVATNQRNRDTISIEVCHPDETGEFSEVTYASLVRLAAWLCRQFGLTQENLIRHYDVSGKLCPLYYVQHEDAWEKLKQDVGVALASV